ncbi:MAG: OmpA family protein [Candidatus Thiodiazotropha sp. (ex Monitilora ramsayi)]|nr:OmpA family protein [Candidatus Thiodiazotropha sp. (ex Monitilora ramsayi)]
MKKRLIALMLTGFLTQQPLFADEEVGSIDTHSLKAAASGVLIGGILAGPPGMLVGLAGGALVSEIGNGQREISSLNQTLKENHSELAQEQMQSAARHRAVKEMLESKHARLSAMEEGFSFCLGFRTDSAMIEPRIAEQLTSITTMLQAFPELKLRILAGADKRGSDTYNRALSHARAEAVADQLKASGLPADRISIHYVGNTEAIYPLDDEEGLGFDRMVQLTLVKGDAS